MGGIFDVAGIVVVEAIWADGRNIEQPFLPCYRRSMTTKEKVLDLVEDLPDNASIEDAMDRLLFLAKVERGIRQADDGMTFPHSQVRERMTKWLS